MQADDCGRIGDGRRCAILNTHRKVRCFTFDEHIVIGIDIDTDTQLPLPNQGLEADPIGSIIRAADLHIGVVIGKCHLLRNAAIQGKAARTDDTDLHIAAVGFENAVAIIQADAQGS